MTFRRSFFSLPAWALACGLALVAHTSAEAQFQLSRGNFNPLRGNGLPVDPGSTATLGQFGGQANSSAAAGPVDATPDNPTDNGAISSVPYERYPAALWINGITVEKAYVLKFASVGGVFASGVPRYSMGDVIEPPKVRYNSATVAEAGYWRARPVEEGEQFINPGLNVPTDPAPLPPAAPYSYYYSPHAKRVLAHQAGRVTILWVTQQPVAADGDPLGTGAKEYRFKEETFSVGSGTSLPVRTIYWTAGNFSGPEVELPAGVVEVKPAFNAFFPSEVAEPYQGVGSGPADPNATSPLPRGTLWATPTAGKSRLNAYNREGRILVEYLGQESPAGSGVHEFLGADLVEVVQAPQTTTSTVFLGEPIRPVDPSGQVPDDADHLVPSPVLGSSQGEDLYRINARPDGSAVYYAEKENDRPDQVTFFWLENHDAGLHFLTPPASPNLSINWPKYRNRYFQSWPAPLSEYVGVTVADNGNSVDTAVSFGQTLPSVAYQDDGRNVEVSVDAASQRLLVNFSQSADRTNRTLLRFSNGVDFWYVRLFIQAASVLGSPEVPDNPGTPNVNEYRPAVETLADRDANGIRDLSTLGGASGHQVVVGQRIERPSASYEIAGYVSAGTGYLPDAYQNPFTAGVAAAGNGAIIPVNAMPGNDVLTVWWFTRVEPEGSAFEPFYVPSASAEYSVTYPTNADRIVMASNKGTGDLTTDQAAGTIYYQNSASLPGFNPNEEHAIMLGGRAYALRDDLNIEAGAGYTSEPFVLIRYVDSADGRPAVKVFEVLREIDANDDGIADPGDILFDYEVTAGSQIPAPMPLPLLPLPIKADGKVANEEVYVTADDSPVGFTLELTGAPSTRRKLDYNKFTLEDRKGATWVYRGPHTDAVQPVLGMQFYYVMRPGFFVPSANPAVGTLLPYLRPLDGGGTPQGDPVSGTPETVRYRPVWPESAPQLRLGETLTLPKFGLPQVRGQASAVIVYDQAQALGGAAKASVVIHDPTVAKKASLSEGALEIMKNEIATSIRSGRTYFQRLPPHLQQRVYANPVFSGATELVLEGEFVDEIAGEDYLNLNVLSESDIAAIKGLDAEANSEWDQAVDALLVKPDAHYENPSRAGTFIAKPADTAGFKGTELVKAGWSDVAVDSYALSSTGQGAGYVSLLFGDGEVFTPEGDPVSIAVIRVVPQLYVGDMKVLYSSNPLDEQVTLRHSGDFAAKPENYEFEWRYASLADGLPPATYEYTAPTAVLDNTTPWEAVQNPAGRLPTPEEYQAGTTFPTLPRTLTIHDTSYKGTATAEGEADLPGVVMRSTVSPDFTSGLPASVIFSAELSNDLDGFVLYVNGIEALAYRAPPEFEQTQPTTGLSSTGLPSQFRVSTRFFTTGPNKIEVALFTDADPGVSSAVNFRLETVTKADRVDPNVYANSPWQQPNGTLLNLITIGGSPSAPLGNPVLLMQDNAFTVRYRPKINVGNVLATGDDQNAVPWSDWMDAQVVPGWIKRVLDAINPYNQRVTDLFSSAVNTDVSVLTQAGARWEGDVALTLGNVNDVGLIEIYETVLNRAKSFSIDNGYDVPGVNDALLLAAGYLNDLYILLGNEAYADAANPTISLDDQDTITEVNTSRFSFEGQVASSLDEELVLLRGRDDFLATSVTTKPAYNRLYWNFTNGIDSGEVLYAVNYNIKEKAGSPTQDGIIDAADAQRMFPQGHGDAYGHYLTALKGYYRLLANPNFTWTPRAEVVTVLGQNVSVDYYDERKFAGAAASVARTAEQVVGLTWRQAYQDDKSEGWGHFRDNKLNSRTSQTRQWGVDEWSARGGTGAYFHWVMGNALLPEEDTNPNHNGIQIVDRQTVPELAELAVIGGGLQTLLDNANAFLNPLGLSPDAVAFDISGAALKEGESHFEQVYDRALKAVLNAKGAFDQAGRMTRSLRNQENQVDDYNTVVQEQERAFRYKLIDLFGTPYSGDMGPGKTYVQGYDGPDLFNWFLIDQATDVPELDLSETVEAEITAPTNVEWDTTLDDFPAYEPLSTETFKVRVEPNRLAQVASLVLGQSAGQRQLTGEMQTAMLEAREHQTRLLYAIDQAEDLKGRMKASQLLVNEIVRLNDEQIKVRKLSDDQAVAQTRLSKTLSAAAAEAAALGEAAIDASQAIAEYFPEENGLGSNDFTFAGRGAALTVGAVAALAARMGAAALTGTSGSAEANAYATELIREQQLSILGYNKEEQQLLYQFQLLVEQVTDQAYEIAALAEQYQRSMANVRNVLARGERLLAEREIFRLRAAALVQGYRTRDVAFRAFRNEALEQYRTLFDLGARYTYLAAKSYDYETGLLGTPQGRQVISRIVASRALGDLTNGIPQATTSTLGDAGLAGTMAQMSADFAVAEGRLGINNPDQNGTLFSVRHELFRILNDPALTSDDDAWQQTLEQHIVSDLRTDTDVMQNCQNVAKADGSPTPGIVIPFSTTILHGTNWFGLPYAGGDHNFSPSNFATKIYSAGAVFPGYVGMDPYAFGTPNAGSPATNDPNVLGATPYLYLIPVGEDVMRAPPLGGTNAIRSWTVVDQALPLPYNLGASAFNGSQLFQTNGTLTEQPWVVRKHQAFRAVDDPSFFYSRIPQEFVSNRLIGRSVWNTRWKIVIPAYSLLNDEQEGLNRFVRSVKDIQLFLRTYSHSGN